MFSLPNQLTLARFFLAIILFVLIALKFWGWCLIVFALAALTDWLDGYLARLQNQMSTLGRNLDPLVDKLLLCGTFIFLLPLGSEQGWLLPWMVFLVMAREMVITSLRSYLENTGANFGADWLGKIKMVLQCGVVFAIFIALKSEQAFPGWTWHFAWTRDGLMYLMLFVTFLSGVQYLWRAAMMYRADS